MRIEEEQSEIEELRRRVEELERMIAERRGRYVLGVPAKNICEGVDKAKKASIMTVRQCQNKNNKEPCINAQKRWFIIRKQADNKSGERIAHSFISRQHINAK